MAAPWGGTTATCIEHGDYTTEEGRKQMAKVKCKDLKVDDRYQRPLKNRVNQIVKNYDPMLVGTIVVSRRKDGLYIVDGQHRVAALLDLFGDEAEVDAQIYYNLTVEEEADLFLRINTGQSKANYNERTKADYASGNEFAREYFNALDESALPWAFEGGGRAAVFIAHSAGQNILKIYGKTVLKEACNILALSDNKKMYDGKCLRAIANIINYMPEVDTIKLAQLLSVSDKNVLLTSATKYGPNFSNNTQSFMNLSKAILELYDSTYQKRKKKMFDVFCERTRR